MSGLQEAPHEHLVAPVDSPYSHSLLKDRARYEEMYRESIEKPAQFWGKMAEQFHWETKVSLMVHWTCSFVLETSNPLSCVY